MVALEPSQRVLELPLQPRLLVPADERAAALPSQPATRLRAGRYGRERPAVFPETVALHEGVFQRVPDHRLERPIVHPLLLDRPAEFLGEI